MKIRHAISLTAAVPAMGASLVLGLVTAHPAHAHPGHVDIGGAECFDADWALIPCPTVHLTVDGVDYPVCVQEDCSDQPGQVGVWVDPDTGNHWLSVGETSYQVQR